MKDSVPTLKLRVQDGGNAIVGEQLTRSLLVELSELEHLEVHHAPTGPPAENAKSGVVGDATLWIFLGTASTAISTVLVRTIKEWALAKRRVVRMTVGDIEIEIPGNLDEAQERVIMKVLEDGRS